MHVKFLLSAMVSDETPVEVKTCDKADYCRFLGNMHISVIGVHKYFKVSWIIDSRIHCSP